MHTPRTPWYATPTGLALIAALRNRPRVVSDTDALAWGADSGYRTFDYTGRKVEAVREFWLAYCQKHAHYYSGEGPHDVLGAVFGDPSNAHRYLTHSDRSSQWQDIRRRIGSAAADLGYPHLATRVRRRQAALGDAQ